MKRVDMSIKAKLLGLALLGFSLASQAAGFLEREVSFSEAEVQAAVDKSKPVQRNYGGLVTTTVQTPPRVLLGTPEGRIGVNGRVWISLLGQPAIPVDVAANGGVRYDDAGKAFYLENPVVTSVESAALSPDMQPMARQAVAQMIAGYFRNKPVYVLREDGSMQEAAARWLLRSIRIEAGRVVAVLAPF